MSLFPLALILVSTVLHASWNLLAHARRSDTTLFIRANLIVGLTGLGPVLWLQFSGDPFPPAVWPLLLATGLFQSVYFLGLTMGYRTGEFSIVYPVARALPVLALAMLDILRGRPPSLLGWAGMGLVTAGCLLAPLSSLRGVSRESYFNATIFWVLVTAAGTVGYSSIDKMALEMLPSGLLSALRYGVLQWLLTVPFLWLFLRFIARLPMSVGTGRDWRRAALATLFISSAYTLILWVYQMIPQASYVVALRQFSIVIGVVAAVVIFREPAAKLRLTAAIVITAGVVLVGLA
ncbi:MAG: EamA family transporter [Caldilineaceae bacterium]|nr:EamA family transporter [Caldilineaceae bacterium]